MADVGATQAQQGVNAEHWAAVTEAKQKILGHPLFQDIVQAKPLAIGSGGQMAGWEIDTMREAFKTQGAYGPVAFNAWHINFNWVPIPGVVVNRAQVANWANHQLQTPPKTFPLTITLVASEYMGLSAKLLSATEPLDALFLRVAEEIANNATDEVLTQWRNVMLQIPAVSLPIENTDEQMWKALNLREGVVQAKALIARRAYQKSMEVMSVKEFWKASWACPARAGPSRR